MDKNVHKILNTFEIIGVLFGIVCICLAAMLRFSDTISGLDIYYSTLLIVGIIAEVMVVVIELLLFYLETVKYKFISILYYIIELLVALWVNSIVPFAGLLVLTMFSMTKNIYRLFHVEVLYRRLGYYELCKKFGIKVKRPRKARVSSTATKKAPVKRRVKEPRAKSTEPNYA